MKEFIRQEAPNIAAYLPKFLCHDREMAEVLSVESLEHDRQRALLIEMFRQLFVHSATWGLDQWEEVLGLAHDGGASDETRRNNILLKLHGKQVSTVEFMRRLVTVYFQEGTNIRIKEQNTQNAFQIVSSGVCVDFSGMVDAIETYKPAHLTYNLYFEKDSTDTPIYYASAPSIHTTYEIHPAEITDATAEGERHIGAAVSTHTAYEVYPNTVQDAAIGSTLYAVGVGSIHKMLEVTQT